VASSGLFPQPLEINVCGRADPRKIRDARREVKSRSERSPAKIAGSRGSTVVKNAEVPTTNTKYLGTGTLKYPTKYKTGQKVDR
jgi:hypothetical protein